MAHLMESPEHQMPVYHPAELRQSQQLHEQMVWLRRRPRTGSKAFLNFVPSYYSRLSAETLSNELQTDLYIQLRKRVSFLSRFIGAKKKDILNETNDDEAETGDRRTEGMDAVVFSQPIEFIPRFPAPPKYIKVRAHNKKEKDFNRVFLAQELRGRTGVEIAQAGGRLVTNGISPMEAKKDGGAVWAMEFSKDGKYLAASGQDFSVRVWAVISTAEERRVHETEEDVAGKDGESVRLNAPVFKTKTVQEYEGHTASILDLSWSKVGLPEKNFKLWHANRSRITSSYHLQWIRLCAFGMYAGLSVYAVSSTVILSLQFNFTLVMTDSFWLAL